MPNGSNTQDFQGALGTYVSFRPLEKPLYFLFVYVKPSALNNLPNKNKK